MICQESTTKDVKLFRHKVKIGKSLMRVDSDSIFDVLDFTRASVAVLCNARLN